MRMKKVFYNILALVLVLSMCFCSGCKRTSDNTDVNSAHRVVYDTESSSVPETGAIANINSRTEMLESKVSGVLLDTTVKGESSKFTVKRASVWQEQIYEDKDEWKGYKAKVYTTDDENLTYGIGEYTGLEPLPFFGNSKDYTYENYCQDIELYMISQIITKHYNKGENDVIPRSYQDDVVKSNEDYHIVKYTIAFSWEKDNIDDFVYAKGYIAYPKHFETHMKGGVLIWSVDTTPDHIYTKETRDVMKRMYKTLNIPIYGLDE